MRKLIRLLGRILLKGLSIVLPITIAVQVVIWLARTAEDSVRVLLAHLLPEGWYVPGSGIALLAAAVFLLGLLMYPWLTRTVLGGFDRVLRNLPLFGSIYSPLKDLMDFFGGGVGKRLGQPVMIKIPNTEMETLGFITREDGAGLPDVFLPDDHLVVYVQWSSQIGGYCFILPREAVRPVEITTEGALRWALTAGLSAPIASPPDRRGEAGGDEDEQDVGASKRPDDETTGRRP